MNDKRKGGKGVKRIIEELEREKAKAQEKAKAPNRPLTPEETAKVADLYRAGLVRRAEPQDVKVKAIPWLPPKD